MKLNGLKVASLALREKRACCVPSYNWLMKIMMIGKVIILIQIASLRIL
nr:hypothetical protein Iba_chr09cCG10970 [Ipomoea batatas]GMD86525.1 hypothetical protein Iba_chr14bCG6880 [Ipomoea batatas]